MKVILIAALVVLAPVVSTASQLVVMNSKKQSLAIAPTDIVHVVSILQDSSSTRIEFVHADGAPDSYLYIGAGQGLYQQPNVVLTGLTAVKLNLNESSRLAVTLKITKSADEMVSQPILLPPATDGVYTLSLETSTDMENWAPAAPGDYLGTSSHRFFRLRAVRKPETDQ